MTNDEAKPYEPAEMVAPPSRSAQVSPDRERASAAVVGLGLLGAATVAALRPRSLLPLGALGVAVGAAWLWDRRGEAALETRTANRLRSNGSDGLRQ